MTEGNTESLQGIHRIEDSLNSLVSSITELKVEVAAEFAEIKAQMQKLDTLERERERERLPSAADFM
jgi:hypothetical protein